MKFKRTKHLQKRYRDSIANKLLEIFPEAKRTGKRRIKLDDNIRIKFDYWYIEIIVNNNIIASIHSLYPTVKEQYTELIKELTLKEFSTYSWAIQKYLLKKQLKSTSFCELEYYDEQKDSWEVKKFPNLTEAKKFYDQYKNKDITAHVCIN